MTKHTSLTFSLAVHDQHRAVESLLRAAFTPYRRTLGRELPEDGFAWLDSAIASNQVFVGMEGDTIVGVVVTCRNENVINIHQIAVLQNRRGSGIGSWLLKETEAVARSNQARALTLNTPEMMVDVILLYRRHGFEEVKRGLPAHGEDAHLRLFMRKDL